MKRFVFLFVLSFFLATVFAASDGSAAVDPQKVPVEARQAPARTAVRQNAPPPPEILKSPPLPQWILDGKLRAKPLPGGMLRSAFPPSVDYSQYITLTRTQDWCGGCFLYAALYVIDILKEREHPYTPDLSYRYAQYYYNDKNVDQKKIHVDYGSCPEAILHTDYDALVWVPPGPGGQPKGYYDDSQCPKPTPQIDAEAKLYRIADTSDEVTGTVANLKYGLVTYGPLWASGTIGGQPHCFAVVGYDDGQQAFKFINSWGDRWNGNGYGIIPYGQVGQMVDYYTYWTNRPSERVGTPDAYSARIRIKHENLRNELTVSVGVENLAPLVVWDRPNETGPPQDGNKDLNIDVPLPSYAAAHWPPSPNNLWCVKVTDGNQNGKAASVGEVTLARLLKSSDGKYRTEVHRPHMATFSVPDGGTRKIYVGAQPPKIELMLTPGQGNVSAGGSLVLSGSLRMTSYDTDPPDVMPIDRKQIKFNSIAAGSDSIEQSQWTQVGTVATDANGKFDFKVTPGATTTYIAVYTRPDGQIIARSSSCTVTVGAKKLAPAIKSRVPIKK